MTFTVRELKSLHNFLQAKDFQNSKILIEKIRIALHYYDDDFFIFENKEFFNFDEDECLYAVVLELDNIEYSILQNIASQNKKNL